MRDRLNQLCRRLSSSPAPLDQSLLDQSLINTIFDELVQAMSGQERAYHNMDHVAACLAQFDIVAATVDAPDTLEAAIWFHDAIYDPKRDDNEAESTTMACQRLASVGAEKYILEDVNRLIMATRHTGTTDAIDEQTMVDIDLSILGQREEIYDQYESAIAHEYAWVPREKYIHGRTKVLQSFLDRDLIYQTPHFQEQYEHQARFNLGRAIKSLARVAR